MRRWLLIGNSRWHWALQRRINRFSCGTPVRQMALSSCSRLRSLGCCGTCAKEWNAGSRSGCSQ